MLLGKFRIDNHAIERYDERIHNKSRGDIIKSINHDLRTLNIKHIVRIKSKGKLQIHVFTRNYKEFIFTQGKQHLYLETVIKRNMDDTKKVLEKRKALVCN